MHPCGRLEPTFFLLSSSLSALDVVEMKNHCIHVVVTASLLQCCFWTFGQPCNSDVAHRRRLGHRVFIAMLFLEIWTTLQQRCRTSSSPWSPPVMLPTPNGAAYGASAVTGLSKFPKTTLQWEGDDDEDAMFFFFFNYVQRRERGCNVGFPRNSKIWTSLCYLLHGVANGECCSLRPRQPSSASLFLYRAPKKYFFAPTTKHNGAQKSNKKQKSRTQSVKETSVGVTHRGHFDEHP